MSPGVAVGRAYCIHEVFIQEGAGLVGAENVQQELARFAAARDRVASDLRTLQKKVSQQVGEEEAAIFKTHEAILHDPTLTAKVQQSVAMNHLSASAALHQLLNEYTSLFARTKDQYIKERLADVRDVVIRLSAELSDVLRSRSPALKGPLVLVADELLPSHVMLLAKRQMAGIVTQTGGQTSHAAILARSRGVPAVSGVAGILRRVKSGDTVVVDGREGLVLINPDAESESAYRKLEREYFHLKDELAANRNSPARTADGTRLELLANVNGIGDAKAALAMGASGVGLYRTEYLFLTHESLPTEKEQLAAYRKIISASPNKMITIRTLDLGGDKTVPFFGHGREANPFMGWRSIRLSFEHPEFFAAQIRAILQAATAVGSKAKVRLLFPMITTLEEMRRVRAMVRRIRRELEAAGQPEKAVPLGLMLEVPAAAVSIEALLDVVDFVSIGSNDLIQYLMAADRDNPKVNHLCEPLSPAVLRVLADVIQACNAAGRPVTLCGEMAGSPRSFLLLLGMGLRSFSMSPAFIPTIKELASHIEIGHAERVFRQSMKCKTTAQIKKLVGNELVEIAPNLKLLYSAQ